MISQKISPCENLNTAIKIELMKISSTDKMIDDISKNLLKFLNDRDTQKNHEKIPVKKPVTKKFKIETHHIPDIDHCYREQKELPKNSRPENILSRDMVDFDQHLTDIIKNDFLTTYEE